MVKALKKIRILNVTFDTELKSFEIPAFRGAIIAKVGQENMIFHNHIGNNEFLYKYPLIQYKQIDKSPAIVCIDYGVDEIHKFFEKRDWSIDISGRTLDMKIKSLQMNQFTIQVWDKKFQYNIYNWIALNKENFQKYQQTDSLVEKYTLLENTLKANILSFAKGIEWTVDKQIEVKLKEIIRIKPTTLKGQKVLSFDASFITNVFLPNHIGLGKSVSLGFGVVRGNRRDENEG